MSKFVFANNFNSKLAAAITSATQDIIEVSSTANIPTIPSGWYWALTLNDAATQQIFEIVYVTGSSGANLSVLRGQEGTAARTWSVNDIAYACATAGVLASFLNADTSGYVELSPPEQQTGSINISGNATIGGSATIGTDITAGGNVSGFGGYFGFVQTPTALIDNVYKNASILELAAQLNAASSSHTGIGPSSGLSAQGITASMLAIASSATGQVIAFDNNGNVGIAGDVLANEGLFAVSASAPELLQNGKQVVDTITSVSLDITRSAGSGTVEIELPNTGQVPVFGSIVNDGNGGDPTISLPGYGSWLVEVIYAVTQTTNSNLIATLALVAGTLTGGFISNANGRAAFNSVCWITLYGKGRTTVNNQTVSFALSISDGSIDPSNQPWTVRATRTA